MTGCKCYDHVTIQSRQLLEELVVCEGNGEHGESVLDSCIMGLLAARQKKPVAVHKVGVQGG